MMQDRLHWWEEIPLGLALLAQSYVVGLWYFASIRGAGWALDLSVAVGAGLALDLIVVTTVMGRRQGRSSGWSWATSLGAFVCSSLIALDRYGWEWRSGLHIAFPLVVFLYSQHLAVPAKQPLAALPERLGATEAPDQVAQDTAAAPLESERLYFEPLELIERPLEEVIVPEWPTRDLPYATEADLVEAQSGGVYAIENISSGRVYIGSTKRFDQRRRAHLWHLANGHHNLADMQDDWIEGDGMAFVFRILDKGLDQLKSREQEWINELSSQRGAAALYNVGVADSLKHIDRSRIDAEYLTVATKPTFDQIANGQGYPCPHCGAKVRNKQALGAAVKNGYCLQCKKER